ncbi:site-2 protease family protein [Roseofilum sp. Guam]|uniref:site-2 protease family protein n=1 Tax=Roseofilum sp. Guam TaxID=2821502 RepID=UPI001B21BB5D|nr:site-2 protease family protein [Roseofilum sp. Guam]MBP0030777.1 site-2 protease family protein [Roseofilum sp. Guam]
MTLLFLLLLGLITYFIVQRGVASSTSTPVWILWLVMMTPALAWTVWIWVQGEDQPPPLGVMIALFVFSSLLYLYLIQVGRSSPPNRDTAESEQESKVAPPPALTVEEQRQLQQCFPWSAYALHETECKGQVVVCRGQLRTSSDVAYQTVREKIEAHFGDRFLIVFQEGFEDKPFFVLIPNPQFQAKSAQPRLTRPMMALGLLALTVLTTTLMGTLAFSDLVSPEVEDNPNLLLENPSLLAPGLPYAIALMTILGIHELGHYLMARRYKIKATLPYFIPIPFFLGTFGAFIQIRSPIPHRKALFDVGIAGPLAGLIVTIPIFMWGLSLSDVITASENTSMFNFDSLNPKATVLLAILSKIALGNQLTTDMAVNLHPVAVAGFLGLVITALNLVPVGQLDGGHVVHAMFGQRTAVAIGQISRLLVLILAFLHQEFLWWAIFLLLMPIADEPALNDVTELDNVRDFLGLLALVILVMIVLPAPPTLIEWFYG